jgi:hypothetical protein
MYTFSLKCDIILWTLSEDIYFVHYVRKYNFLIYGILTDTIGCGSLARRGQRSAEKGPRSQVPVHKQNRVFPRWDTLIQVCLF